MHEEPVIEVIKPREVAKLKAVEPERKIETRLEELKKILKAKKLCLRLSNIPLFGSIILFVFSYWLYYSSELILILPERFSIVASYNLTVWLAVLWLCVAIATIVHSKLSKELLAHNVAITIGFIALFSGLFYLWLAYWLNLGIEIYTNNFAPYNIAFSIGIISVVSALFILALGYRMKSKFL